MAGENEAKTTDLDPNVHVKSESERALPDGNTAIRTDGGVELQLKQSELALKERDVVVKEGELELKRRDASATAWRSPLVLSVLGAALAAGGNAAVSYFNAKQQRELEDRKSEQARILEMIKTGSPDKAAENLKFLVDAGLIFDTTMVGRLSSFLRERKPGTGPSLPTPGGNSIAERLSQVERSSGVGSRDAVFFVSNHVLFRANGNPVTVAEAMFKGSGRLTATKAIVLHFSADSGTGATEHFMSASQPGPEIFPASAHIVIRRDGSVTQLVAFDVPAFHAGVSEWNGLTGLNKYSIGIMFENRGQLRQVDGKWELSKDKLFLATEGGKETGWERYTQEQMDSAREVVRALGRAYPSIEAVLRHSEIAPGRKVDPGPALDVEPLSTALREGRQMAAEAHVTTNPATR